MLFRRTRAGSRPPEAKCSVLRSALAATVVLFCTFLGSAPPAEAADTVTSTADADAWVSDDAPDANHGADTTLQVDGSQPISRAYLRFMGPTIPQGAIVTRTTLRLYFASASERGFDVRRTSSNNWDEQTITFNNASSLGLGGPVSSTPPITAGWNSVAVPLLNPGSATTYVLTRASAEGVSVHSRENLNKPQLVVEYVVPSTTPTSTCSAAGCLESRPWIYTISWATTVADFNGDGRDDHLVGRQGFGDQIQLQQPDGAFAPGFPFPPVDRHGCTAGDVDLDGRIDLFCQTGAGGGEGTHQNELWIAKPDGTYVDQATAWGLTDPYGRGRRPLLFDFDNDGLLDLYTTNLGFRPDGLRSENILYLNRGDPSTGGSGFVEKTVTATGSWGEHCVAGGNWNNDPYRDFLVCGPQTSVALHLFQNQGGTATERTDWLLGAAPVNFPRDATLSDLNGDGWDDLVIVTAGELQIRLNLRCATCARFSQVDQRVSLLDGMSVAVGDLTGDGFKDLYVVQGFANDRNADDLLLAGPGWGPLELPQTNTGTGNTAEFIDILGRKAVIVTNGWRYSRGPVQFISFHPNTSATPPPPAQVPPSPTAPAASSPSARTAQLPSAAHVVQLPSSRRCATRRNFRIRIRRVAGVTFVSAAVFVNRKRIRIIRQNLAAPVSLRRLPKGKFVVKIVITTADGRKLARSRKYRSC